MGTVRVNSIVINGGIGPFQNNKTITSVDLGKVPWTTSYMSRSFEGCNNLTEVTNFPNTLTRIAGGVFHNCTNLVTLPKLPDSIINVGGSATAAYDIESTFGGSKINTTDFLPNNVVNIAVCFRNTAYITEVNYLPNSIEMMDYSFYNCNALTTVTHLPSHASSLGFAFSYCANLTSIAPLPMSVTNLATCFSYCTNLTQDIYIESTNVTNATNMFSGTSAEKNIYIPYNTAFSIFTNTYNAFNTAGYIGSTLKHGVTVKENPHFEVAGDWWWCNYDNYLHRYLNTTIPTTITIPNSINGKSTKLPPGAFTKGSVEAMINTGSLTSIDINHTLIDNSYYLFCGCAALQSISNIDISKSYNLVYLFFNCQSLTNIPTNFSDGPNNMTGTFTNCFLLNNVQYIPSTVTKMGGTFINCYSLTSVPALPKTVTAMNACFFGCNNLTSIQTIPNGITNLVNCFVNCRSLTNLPALPDTITNMLGAFANCYGLTDIYIKSNMVTNARNSFSTATSPVPNRRNVYIPFKNSDGTNSATYNAFIAAGYKTDGSYQNVYLTNYAGLY